MKGEWIVFKGIRDKNMRDIESYEKAGGYEGARKALMKMSPQEVIEEVKKSGLRGRGGAGFPTGVKWDFIPKNYEGPKYLCCNADEGEPGTFKDREIMLHIPHQLIEGIIIASYAIGARLAFIYIRGEFVKESESVRKAIEEARSRGYLGKNIFGGDFSLDIIVHLGAGAYICGEETALINSLEGKRGWPRLRPPFPATYGLYGKPTIVNNVETLSAVPFIIREGYGEFKKYGTEKSPGTRLFAVSGWVKNPGVYEREMGIPLNELINEVCGGPRDGKKISFAIPGGISSPPLRSEEFDVKMDFESLAQKGTMAGSGGVMVLQEGVCPVKICLRAMKFYEHESCGQCTPCREGTGWARAILEDIEGGRAEERDLEILYEVSRGMIGTTICPLGDSAGIIGTSYLKKFREDFEKHIKSRQCPYGGNGRG